jgi:precorrin-4/cobalt-precorrin-4 C11-methyltransferase
MFKNNEILFVGAGPGDPDFITVAGQKALSQADLIVVAGSLVNPEILKCRNKNSKVVDSAALNLEQIVDCLIKGHQNGQKVVRLHTGDPSIYGAIHEQLVYLKKASIPFRIIPGVTAATAAAASLGLEFTIPELTQTLILTRMEGRTPMPLGEDLASLASHRSSLAIYLSATRGEEASKILSGIYGPKAPVVLCYRATWPGAKTIWTTAEKLAQSLEAEKLDRHTLILVGPALNSLLNNEPVAKSKLYDPEFTHGFRKSTKVDQ